MATLHLLVLLAAGPWASALRAHVHARRSIVRRMASEITVRNEVTGNNVKVTDSMRQYVEDKIGATVERYGSLVTRCDTHLSVQRNPSVTDSDSCETVIFAGDVVVRAEERTSSMYSSIDLVAAKIGRKLRKLKERRESRKQRNVSIRDDDDAFAEATTEATTEEVTAADEPLAAIVKTKQFAMPPQTLADAKFCLDALDHEFYVFRSAHTGLISVLYKRHEGDLGLIEPEPEK